MATSHRFKRRSHAAEVITLATCGSPRLAAPAAEEEPPLPAPFELSILPLEVCPSAAYTE